MAKQPLAVHPLTLHGSLLVGAEGLARFCRSKNVYSDGHGTWTELL